MKDDTHIHCETHRVSLRWGDLDEIQRLAVEGGIDTVDDMPCLLLPQWHRDAPLTAPRG